MFFLTHGHVRHLGTAKAASKLTSSGAVSPNLGAVEWSQWSRPWQLFWHSFWYTIWKYIYIYIYLFIFISIYLFICRYSDLLSDIFLAFTLTFFLAFYLASIIYYWRTFWHLFWHSGARGWEPHERKMWSCKIFAKVLCFRRIKQGSPHPPRWVPSPPVASGLPTTTVL